MKTEILWKELTNSSTFPVFRRVDDSHPLNIYAGIAENLNPLLLLVTKEQIVVDETFQSLRVHTHVRDDGDWSYTVSLDEGTLRPLFSLLCDDLIGSTRNISSHSGAKHFFIRLGRWRALLASGSTGLNEDEVRGLLGELFALSELLAPMFGIETAVFGWSGPNAEEQDFRIMDRAFEIKTIPSGKVKANISSLRQLEVSGGRLDLIIIPMNPAPPSQGHTIAEFVERIGVLVSKSAECTSRWQENLILAGVVETDPGIRRPYAIASPLFFRVDEHFPRLSPSTVPPAVVAATYTLDLSLCKTNARDSLL